jgi:uncharacterized damage-inducible protein DinB
MTLLSKTLSFRELLDYSDAETRRWQAWIARHPQALELPVGSGRTATVRGLVHHIIVVENRYTDRLRGEPVRAYESVPADPIDETFMAFEQGRAKLESWLASATDEDMARPLTFETISAGTLSASARKIVAHLLLHGLRHWAQLATAMRQQGYPTDWAHDILMSDALE